MKDLTHLEISDYVKILWTRRWYFLIVFVLVASGVSAYAYWMPDIYKSETRIAVEEPMVSSDYVRPTVPYSAQDRMNSIYQQLASRTFLKDMIEKFGMFNYGNPGFSMEDAINAASSRIKVDQSFGGAFTISFTSTDPQFAQMITAEFARELIKNSTYSSEKRVIATDEFIEGELEKTKKKLDELGAKITKFKLQHLGELPSQSDANMTALNGRLTQLAATESAIQQAQERLKLLDFKREEHQRVNLLSDKLAAQQKAAKEDAPSPLEAELASKKDLLAQYRTKYMPNYPDVVALQREIERIEQQIQAEKTAAAAKPDSTGDSASAGKDIESGAPADPTEAQFQFEANSIKAEIAERKKQKQEIEQQIKLYQSRLNIAPSLEQDMAALLREEKILRDQYDNLQSKKFSSDMAKTVETNKDHETYTVIDEANRPDAPEYPNRLQMVLLGIGGGLVLGMGAALGRELLDTTIGSEEEAKRVLDLPVLVTIPTVPKEKKRRKTA